MAGRCRPLIRSWATFEEDYAAATTAFLDGPFAVASVGAKLAAWEAQIEPLVSEAFDHNSENLSPQQWRRAMDDLDATIHELRDDMSARVR